MNFAITSQDLANARDRVLENRVKVEEQLNSDLDKTLRDKVRIGHECEVTKQELSQERPRTKPQEPSGSAQGCARPNMSAQIFDPELDVALKQLKV